MTRWVRTTVDMLEHDILNVGPYDRRSAWLWLITHAAWKDKRVNHKGRPLALKRGQVLAGRAFLAETWGWSEKQVRLFIHLLEQENMIEKGQSNGHFANVITICNYGKYQTADQPSQPEEGPEQGQSRASVGPEQGQTLTIDTITTIVPKQGDAHAREPRSEVDQKIAMRNALNPMASTVRATSIGWELNGSTGIRYASGKLSVECPSLKSELQADFPGIDLAAVCNKAATEIARGSRKTHEVAIAAIRRAAQFAAEDRARQRGSAPATKTTVLDILNRETAMN